MTNISELKANVQSISVVVTGSLRTNSSTSRLAGWGQFLEAASPVFQIGPYGTAAGVVINQIAFPANYVDSRVKAQLQSFWDERPNGKLYPQNVRLAFTVLALAKVSDPALIALRDEIAATLRERQLADGSWSDALPHPTSTAGGQPDATAWTVLALRRSGGSDLAAQRGAAWLADRIGGSRQVSLLSTLGVAAAVAGHANSHSAAGLRARGFSILANASVNREELISFFDYDELRGTTQVQARDYLCYPAFYPIAVLIAALHVAAGPYEAVRLDAFRSDAIRRLSELSGGHPYKNQTARFSSTVDQAMYALASEELAAAESGASRATGIVAPLYKWSKNSIFVQLLMPILLILILALLLASPITVAGIVKAGVGKSAVPLVNWVTKHNSTLQVFVGLAATLIFGTPKRGRSLLWDRLRGQRR